MTHKLHLSKRARLIAVIASVSAALLMISVALAATVVIDDFSTTNQSAKAEDDVMAACNARASVTSALSNTRELSVTKFTDAFGSSVSLVSTGGTLGYNNNGSITSTAEVIWDGVNNSCALDPSGFGGTDLYSGTNDGILVGVVFNDIAGVTMTLKIYSGSANWSQAQVKLPGGILVDQRTDFFVPFSGFTTMNGTGFISNSVGAMVLGFDNRGPGAGADVIVKLVQATSMRDYGDAPNTYSTALASNGARHLTSNGLRLGANVDAETNGAPGDTTGDDTASSPDDEDGVLRNRTDLWLPDATVHVTVTVSGCSGTCRLNAWMDWDNSGTFGSGEQVFNDSSISDGANQNLSVVIPSDYISGTDVYARFRLCNSTSQCSTYYGEAPNGEVEDYLWTFLPTSVNLASFTAVKAGDHNALAWETTSEIKNQGFNVWRGTSASAPDVKLNQYVIPSQAPGGTGGFEYSYNDFDITSGVTYYYWLEDVDLNGTVTRHNPPVQAVGSDNSPTALTLTALQASSPVSALPLVALGLALLIGVGAVVGRRRS